jgi:hypothetical protein
MVFSFRTLDPGDKVIRIGMHAKALFCLVVLATRSFPLVPGAYCYKKISFSYEKNYYECNISIQYKPDFAADFLPNYLLEPAHNYTGLIWSVTVPF